MIGPNIYTPTNLASPAWVQGFIPVSFTNTVATFSIGSARALNGESIIEYPGSIQNLPGQIALDTTVVGAGGCFPLPIASVVPESGFVTLPVYACYNSAGTTGGSLNSNIAPIFIISTAGNGPFPPATGFVPSGYD